MANQGTEKLAFIKVNFKFNEFLTCSSLNFFKIKKTFQNV